VPGSEEQEAEVDDLVGLQRRDGVAGVDEGAEQVVAGVLAAVGDDREGEEAEGHRRLQRRRAGCDLEDADERRRLLVQQLRALLTDRARSRATLSW